MISTIERLEQDSLAQKLYVKNEAEREGIKKGEIIGLQKGKIIGLQKGKIIGIQEGEIIGIKKGLQEGIKKIAINMLKADMPIKQIATVTGLTEEEISKLEQQ